MEATQLAEETDLMKFQATYSEASKRVSLPMPQPLS